uniref:MARVEL domain-containing protein n=1 Tax=Bionectria ochroleuca TaxID=29856 RepID=A0A8H7KBU5_BIOOC
MKTGSFGILTIIHALLALFLIIELGLVSYVVDITWRWSAVQFLLFTVVWSILVLVYVVFAPAFLPRAHIPIAVLAVLGITMIFWFAGATAVAADIGVPDCMGNRSCQVTQASVAFAYFIWAGFLGLFGLEAMAYWKSRGPAANADKV